MLAWTVTIITLLVGIAFKFYQDKNRIGGKIAWSKSFWLSYTILAWFILPPILYFSDFGPGKNVLMIVSLSFWVRGIAELMMLFIWKNWKPLYGITHNLFTIALGAFLHFYNRVGLDRYSFVLLGSIFISLLLETYYAYFFHKHVGADTQGDEAVWFANNEDPKFKNLLRITSLGNIFVYGCLGYFLLNQ